MCLTLLVSCVDDNTITIDSSVCEIFQMGESQYKTILLKKDNLTYYVSTSNNQLRQFDKGTFTLIKTDVIGRLNTMEDSVLVKKQVPIYKLKKFKLHASNY